MSTQIRPDDVIGHKAVDVEGNKIGSVEQVFVSDTTGSPEWVTVKRGLFRSKEIFVPLRGASMSGDQLRLAYLKEKVSGAPDLEVGRHLSVEEEQELYRYYGLSTTGPGRPGEAGAGGGAGDFGRRAGGGAGTAGAAGTGAAAGTTGGTGTAPGAGAEPEPRGHLAGRDRSKDLPGHEGEDLSGLPERDTTGLHGPEDTRGMSGSAGAPGTEDTGPRSEGPRPSSGRGRHRRPKR
ncbi:PRC-barrel domain-containing protein [Streptomyces sp. HB2AG]|uniref:PRC-barrel domain-containing protein n=1 Tax=Streptomyces sp. HB2AG TaxID=2983400 RepID=UPI0022AA5027|nr:PRC-barrel domain-containing protein [Streptomyces sp. HB2AG]MCZ2526146.1 PRC-barrel domain-containing protein [Streptomyces sp. HB2AG]